MVSLVTTATQAQTDSLKLRFNVPFPFTVENATFSAGEYEVTQPSRMVLELRNLQNQAAAFQHLGLPFAKGSDRADEAHLPPLRQRVFPGCCIRWVMAVDLRFAAFEEEKQLADASPMPHLKVISVLANGTVEATNRGQ